MAVKFTGFTAEPSGLTKPHFPLWYSMNQRNDHFKIQQSVSTLWIHPNYFQIPSQLWCTQWRSMLNGQVLVCRINTLRPRQNGRPFPDDIFKCIFLNISLKFVPKGPINNIPALLQMMAWRRPGDKPLYETVLVSLLTHICITRPQWVNSLALIGRCRCNLKSSISNLFQG